MDVWVREIPTMVEAFDRGAQTVASALIISASMIAVAILYRGRKR